MQLHRGFSGRYKWIVEVCVDELQIRRIGDGSLDCVPTTIVRYAESVVCDRIETPSGSTVLALAPHTRQRLA